MSRRSDRVAGLVRREMGQLLDAHLTDPRLAKLVTIARVRLTEDLGHATLGITVLGDGSDAVEVMRGLDSAKGFLRRELGNRLGLKRTPELHFEQDATIGQGDHVLDLLDTIKEASSQ